MALTNDFNSAYDRLMAAWLEHEDLRHGGSIHALSASRAKLDALRYEMAVVSHRAA